MQDDFADGVAPGERIGPYLIREKIGEGGFADVYAADQMLPLRRRVALKVIKPGMESQAILARFEVERQTLALMRHPNIATVFDAGLTPRGRPFFVMERVAGPPITKACDGRRMSIDDRLRLFMEVCEAVNHAHGNGVIHRDIKPGNILVEDVQGRPAPRIIDFGVAKALTPRHAERAALTECGQLIGTLEYMSPEQAAMTASGVDERADVYALGVVLYELLTGTLPFGSKQLRAAGFPMMLSVIRNAEPDRPSDRLERMLRRDRDGIVERMAARRRVDGRGLRRRLRGDLDWIVMRCLEKDPRRRYLTPVALARDIARSLDGHPVDAGPPSATYRFSRYARRWRSSVVAAAPLLLALFVGMAVASFGFVRAEVARRDAAEAEHLRSLEADAWQRLFARLDAEQLGRVTSMMSGGGDRSALARGFIDEAVIAPALATVDDEVDVDPLAEAALRDAARQAYFDFGMYEPALAQAELVVALRRDALGADHAWTVAAVAALDDCRRMLQPTSTRLRLD